MEHGDSVGNRGVIGPGDVQWMTAARGIIHNEFHSRKLARDGGTLVRTRSLVFFALRGHDAVVTMMQTRVSGERGHNVLIAPSNSVGNVPALGKPSRRSQDEPGGVPANPGDKYQDVAVARLAGLGGCRRSEAADGWYW